MSMKLAVEIGYFDPETCCQLTRRVDGSIARQAIVEAGGCLHEQNAFDHLHSQRTGAAIPSQPKREVLGFVGNECVILHEWGFLITTVGYGPHGPMWRFLQRLCGEHGCEVYFPDDGKCITKELLSWLASRE
jgi:hypothetical protein